MFKFTTVLVFVVSTWRIQEVDGTLQACSQGGQSDCDKNEPHSVCVNGSCACLATYKESASNCVRVSCSSNANVCTTHDKNSFCDTKDFNCHCKTNFVETGVDCARKTCSKNLGCINLSNTYCGSSGCTCGFSAPAHPTTGVCTPKPCTSNDATACAGKASCSNSNQCVCGTNMIPGATSCVLRPCPSANCTVGDSSCACEVDSTTAIATTSAATTTSRPNIWFYAMLVSLW